MDNGPVPLTPGEFELMEIVWRLGDASVRQIWKEVDPGRRLAYTTVMTVLDKMYRKGAVVRRKQGKAHVYRPAIARQAAVEVVVEQVVRTYFAGCYAELAAVAGRRTLPASTESAGTGTPPGRPPAEDPSHDSGQIEEFLL